ncbi:MAG: TonB-dependent receptor plug domain-containing protein [Ginsengibacter sp.]
MKLKSVAPLKKAALVVMLFCKLSSYAQNEDSIKKVTLPEVLIKAFEQNRKLKDVPAAINYISKQTLESFSTSSIVSAVNATPGVRMEERSPGSYRLNIRGSSLRSPFGVRNVKIYYNDIPYTDPGGNSYLNQLGYYNFNSIEIIKGSNNSLYGAGTGGVLLIESLNENEKPEVTTEYTTGSYNLQNLYASVSTVSDKLISRVGFQHQESDGYRVQSRLKRNLYNWNGLFTIGKNRILKTTFLYSDHFYETPGALTKSEFEANPKAARPGNAFSPGAEQANAFIQQKMFLAGASYVQPISSKLQNKTTLYGMFTQLNNPNLRGYDKSTEPHAGGRTVFKFQHPLQNGALNVDAGGELQQGFASVHNHKNVNGNADSLRSYDEINNRQAFVFAQASLDVSNWTIIAGASLNTLRVNFQRFMPATLGKQKRTFNNQLAPRFALMKKFKQVNIYTSIAKGFSPPTTAELLPTGGAINLGLNAEEGINYDIGVKGNLFKQLYVDVNLFFYSLKNTIVTRRDVLGGDFFVNAGKTKQHGIETLISYPLFLYSDKFKKGLFWISHTWHDFHYKNFKQLANDFSGKQLPSVAPHTISSGIDLTMNNGLLGGLTYFYSDKIPLNDANSEYAKAYHLLSAKIGFEKSFNSKLVIKVFGGIENLLDETYSLGNDINGFGGRYYNAAPRRNFYATIIFHVPVKRNND